VKHTFAKSSGLLHQSARAIDLTNRRTCTSVSSLEIHLRFCDWKQRSLWLLQLRIFKIKAPLNNTDYTSKVQENLKLRELVQLD
ncbi:hypothetical protein S83_043429, partial [Arachis hypogaea]